MMAALAGILPTFLGMVILFVMELRADLLLTYGQWESDLIHPRAAGGTEPSWKSGNNLGCMSG